MGNNVNDFKTLRQGWSLSTRIAKTRPSSACMYRYFPPRKCVKYAHDALGLRQRIVQITVCPCLLAASRIVILYVGTSREEIIAQPGQDSQRDNA